MLIFNVSLWARKPEVMSMRQAVISIAALLIMSGCAGGRIYQEQSEPTTDAARFVAEAFEDVSASTLEQKLEAVYGERVIVRPLFDDTGRKHLPADMRRMFRIAVPSAALPPNQPWENAYRLEAAISLKRVEPDLADTLASRRESTESCQATTSPPIDTRWSLKTIRAPEAWALPLPVGGKAFGEGITVCHPDTGWTEHIELDSDRLDLRRALNLLGNGSADAMDPLLDSGPLLNPGHGTATGSVIVSNHQRGRIDGVAPAARLVPIRTAKSVIQLFDSDLARAVNYAVDAECDVISMSLGGRAFFGLEAAIRRAVRANLIVAAAAGNCVGFVVAPAAYDDTIAVAATNVRDEAWIGSSSGPAVEVSAPGEHVWTARRRAPDAPTDQIDAGEGTSYAVANVAGAAALWLAYEGKQELLEKYAGRAPMQEVFRRQLRGSARVPATWPEARLGAGVLDVAALLERPLPPQSTFLDLARERAVSHTTWVAAVLGLTPADAAPLLARMLQVQPDNLESALAEWGPELVQLALSHPQSFRKLVARLQGAETTGGAAGGELILKAASPSLRAHIEH